MLINSCANCSGRAASSLDSSQQLGKTGSEEMLHLVKFGVFGGAVKLGGAADTTDKSDITAGRRGLSVITHPWLIH